MKPVIVHLHTDYKFVRGTDKFDNILFKNIIIIIQKEAPFTEVIDERVMLFNDERKSIKKIISICNQAEMVVINGLEHTIKKIVLSLKLEVIIIWRFFGYELYGKITKSLRSYLTKEITNEENNRITIKERVRTFLEKIKYGSPDKRFTKLLKRIDYMILLCKEEYDYLKKHWSHLPCFLQYPYNKPHHYSFDAETFPKNKDSKQIIVIGNNRSAYNNHIDIIETVENNLNKSQYLFKLPLNYGIKSNYFKEIKERVIDKEYFEIIEDFIPPDEYLEFYKNISALVINGHRQMAVGNIFMAIRHGTKVYLNKKNVYMQFLLNEGFYVYPIEELNQDLSDNNLSMDFNNALHNYNCHIKLSEKYSNAKFNSQIYNILKNNTLNPLNN